MLEKLKKLRTEHLLIQHELTFYPYQELVSDKILDALLQNLKLTSGATEEDIKKLANLNNGQEFVASTNLHAPVSVQALASTLENAVESFDEFMPLKKVLVKQAAYMTNKMTVDAMLSLGLINKKNLLEYVSMIPNYEVVLSQLTELLLMTRLGMSGVNEEALSDTIESLSQVVQGLKEIQGVTALK
jgi:hypothetical protein